MAARPKPAKPRRRSVRLGAAALALAALAVGGFHALRPDGVGPLVYADEEWLPVAGSNANHAARAASFAFDDAQRVWARRFEAELGRTYRPASLVYFTVATPSPCAGADIAAGPFYCAVTETAALDLTFLELLGSRLFHRGEAGAALMVARVAAGHVQSQLGARDDRRGAAGTRSPDLAAALQADCLTGVWARHSADWLGDVEASFYGQLVLTAREIIDGRPRGAVAPDPALFGPGTPDERGDAFARGRDAGAIAACV